MKKKPGRPFLPKGKAKGVLYAVRVSGGDAKIIDSAIKRSGKEKPDWMRNALLSAASKSSI